MNYLLLLCCFLTIVSCKPGSKIEDGFLAGVAISSEKSTVEFSATTVMSGYSVTMTMTTRDSSGNIFYLPHSTPEIELSLSGGTSTGDFSQITDNANGTYTVSFSGHNAGTASKLNVRINGTELSGDIPSITVLPGNYSLALSQVSVAAATVKSDSAVTVTLHAYDTSGNPFTTGGLSVQFSATGGTSTGTFGAVTDHNNGTYSATFTGITVGTATSLRAAIGAQLVTSVYPTVSVLPGPASQLFFTSSPVGDVAPGVPLSTQPAVKIVDAQGNTVTIGADSTANITMSLTSGTGSVGGTATVAAVAGVATFTDISVNSQGSGKVLTATKSSTVGSGGTGALTKTSGSFLIHPPAPGAFTISSAVAGNSQVVLSWGSASDAASYTVKYGTSSGSYPTTVSTNATSPVTISSLTAGTDYYFQVEASNITGTTSATSEAVSRPLSAFTISSITVDATNKLKVNFGNSTGASAYTVKFGTVSGVYSFTDSTSATSPYEIASLTGGNTYYVMVTATNAYGSVNATAEASAIPINAFNATSLTPDTGSTKVSFPLTAGATSYDVLYDTSSHTAVQPYASSSVGVTSPANISGLSAGTTYYYRVRANNAYGSVVSTNELSGAVYQTFTLSIPFTSGTTGQYAISNAASVEFTAGGVARLTSPSLTDEASTDFQAGTLSGVQWDGTGGYLRLDSAYNSGIFDGTWAPQANSMVAYWKMDNNFNDSVGTYHASIVGSPSATSPGKVGSHYGTFSSGSYGSIASPPALANSSFSISAWVYPTSNAGVHQHILGYGTTTTDSGLFLGYTSTGTLRVGFYNDDLTTATNYMTYDYQRWVHLAATYDATTRTRTLYRDGVVIASDTAAANFAGTGTMYVGQGLGTNGFNGNMDEFAIWTTALTSSQVANIFATQRAKTSGLFTSRVIDSHTTGSTYNIWSSLSLKTTLPFYKEIPATSENVANYSGLIGSLNTNLAGFWHMNESAWNGTAGEVIDASGNNRHGVRTGTATTSTVGRFGSSGLFGSSGDSVVTDSGSAFIPSNNSPLTVSAWVLAYNIGTGGAGAIDNRIISIHSGSVASSTMAFGLGNTNKLMFYTKSTTAFVSSTTNMPKNVWTHVALTFNGTCFQMYINGTTAGACHAADLLAGGSFGTRLGSYSSASSSFNGLIDEMGIWKRSLTAAEIHQLYRRGVNRVGYQVRTCSTSNCADQDVTTNAGWKGPDNSAQSMFSELYNTTNNILAGTVAAGSPTMTFANFGPLSVTANRYFQYRAYLASDDANTGCTYNAAAASCSPEIQYAATGPSRYNSSAPSVTATAAAVTSVYEALDKNSFSENLGGNGCSAGVKYALSHNGVNYYYWNGTTWAASTNAATANDATTLSENLDSFASTVGTGTLQVRAYLQSTGLSQCELNSLTLTGKKY
ncbi:LamG-like jellyroll fold domain-containing protein [Bdellovibrio bacteriovorus]|uniref:Fibronectin type-III domain-containing protein n=1 Tax=Bdellovibrio bacteriovorus TaxID=959 RepID=A0A1Z3N4U3_BDEBC|nr:LamG-like jellyroll fold domain-containing protein [Bdellovibrio bacteriovorus]ASD62489.1 hypothetical protein B9G79_02365 [Bdellovibrio bacteriovorus]